MADTYKFPSFQKQSALSAIQLCVSGSYRLADFQWRFAVTTKHSLMNQTDCLIQLKLILHPLSKLSEDTNKIVHLELSMAEFNEFFREMEKIANTLAIIN